MADIILKADGSIEIDPAGISESHYLVYSNKEKCQAIFSKQEWRDGELVDGYIALHIVLEASLNSLFRELALRSLVKKVDEIEVMKNIDRISFIDKTTLFIYNSKFDFGGRMGDATKYHAVIGKLRAFCEIRNQLLHGHAIATVTDSNGVRRHTGARQNISYKRLVQQLNDFRFIVEGLGFYLDCLESVSGVEKKHLRALYLNADFLPADVT